MANDTILALDLATVLGCAVGRPGEKPTATTHRIAPPETPVGRFLSRYSDWLADQITVHEPDILIFEAPILTVGKTSIDTARKLMCLAGLTEMIAYRRAIPSVWEADTGTVTKFFTGKGSWGSRDAKKAAVMAECRRLGWHAADDNAADALALWRWAEFKHFPKARADSGALFRSVGAA